MGEEYVAMGEMSYGFLKEFLKEKRKDTGKFFVKNKVGFLPKGMDYSIFQEIKRKAIFKQLKFLVGKHKTLRIVIVGLYIQNLDKTKRAQAANKLKQEVYDKHGPKGVSILNMAATGFIELFVKWLSDYHTENDASRTEMADLYVKILEDWKEMAFFVKGTTSRKTLRDNIFGRINSGKSTSFVFASGSAISVADQVFTSSKKEINGSGYDFSTGRLNDHYYERVWIIGRENPKEI